MEFWIAFVTSFLTTCLLSDSVTCSLENGVLAVHNEHRLNAGLNQLTWDAALATEAQSYNDFLTTGSCSLEHYTQTGPHAFITMSQGENLFLVGSTTYSDQDLGNMSSRAWYSEIDLYKFPGQQEYWDFCVNWQDVGHFTQMMWFNTAKIGCGSGTCNGNSIVTCHYVPAGNARPNPLFADTNYNQLLASGEQMERCPNATTTLSSYSFVSVYVGLSIAAFMQILQL